MFMGIMFGSKLGIHAIQPGGNTTALIQESVNRSISFSTVKGVDCPELGATVKKINPNILVINRFNGYNDVQSISDLALPNYDLIAKTCFVPYDKMTLEQKIATDYFEPINEPSPPGDDGYTRLSTLQKYLIDEANKRRVKILIYTLNAGTPEWSQMKVMVSSGVFETARIWGHGLALHEGIFGGDKIDKGFGDAIPHAPYVPGAGSLCFRYRFLYQLLKEINQVIPLFITELRVNGGGDDYKLSDDEVVKRINWYDTQFRKDGYGVSFLPFTIAPSTEWITYDYTYAYPKLLTYMESIRFAENKWMTNQQIFNFVGQLSTKYNINLVGRIPFDLMHSMLIDRQGTYLGPSPLQWFPNDVLLELLIMMVNNGWK